MKPLVKAQISDAVVQAPRSVLEAIVYRVCVVVASSGEEGEYEWSDAMEAVLDAIQAESPALGGAVKP